MKTDAAGAVPALVRGAVAGLFLPAVILWSSHAAGQGGLPGGKSWAVTVQDGMVSIHARGVRLDELLGAISLQAGIAIYLYTLPDTRVSMDFDRVPLEQALQRVLRGRNYTLETGARDAGLRTVRVLPAGKARFHAADPSTSHDPDARADAVSSLAGEDGSRVIPALGQALRDHDPDVRQAAIYTLALTGGDEAVDTLGYALNDPDTDVRGLAIEALDQIGGDRARILLQQALGDGDPQIRDTAARLLERADGGE